MSIVQATSAADAADAPARSRRRGGGSRLARRRRRAGILLSLPAVIVVVALLGVAAGDLWLALSASPGAAFAATLETPVTMLAVLALLLAVAVVTPHTTPFLLLLITRILILAILAMSLLISGQTHIFVVPFWVIAASAGMMGLGSLFGGWRLIRTLGGRIYKIRPVHAFTSQAASAFIVLGAALLGGPVSASQVVGTAIMGAGAAERVNKVRWQVAQDMLVTWVLTIPASAFLAGILYWLVAAPG